MYNVIDLFAGAGGLSLGAYRAGFNVVVAVENDKDACRTHKANFPQTRLLEKDITKKLSGLRFNATVYLLNGGDIYYYEKGELLFKDDALSGIVTFNVSNRLAYLFKTGNDNNPELVIDFCNTLDTETLVNLIYNSNDIKETLMGIVHPTLAELIYDYSKNKKEIVQNLASFKFKVKSLGDFEHAQITSGGVKLVEIKDNLESVFIPGLYFAGDVLDIDAQCGGFNLSFAFLSGIKVGRSIE